MPLRRRLVLGFSVAMAAVLLAAGAFVYWRVAYALDRSLDRDLDDASSALAPLVTQEGRVRDPTAVAAAGVVYQVLDADGRLMAGSRGDPLVSPADLKIPQILPDGPSIVRTIREHHARWKARRE